MSNLNLTWTKHKEFLSFLFVDSDIDQIASKSRQVVSKGVKTMRQENNWLVTRTCDCEFCVTTHRELVELLKRKKCSHNLRIAIEPDERRIKLMTYMQNLYAATVETARSHRATEAQKDRELAETERSHRVNEALSEADLNEKIRHQITQDTETMRHNMASEAEISLHNRNTEAISRRANQIAATTAALNYAVQHERNVNERDIAELQNQTKLFLESAQLRISESNSKAQQQTATAKLMEAKAKIDAAQASLMNAATNADLAPSQKFANIGRGVRDLTTSVESVSDIVQDWIPQTKVANTVADSTETLSKQARKTGKANAKGTGKTAREILTKSGHADE